MDLSSAENYELQSYRELTELTTQRCSLEAVANVMVELYISTNLRKTKASLKVNKSKDN